MATIAIGDIHGVRSALDDVLAQVRSEADDDDVVVFLGDYIDRGPDSRGCIDAILKFRDESAATVSCLRGNHEDWLSHTEHDYSRHSWLLGMDGLSTVRSYSANAEAALRSAMGEAGVRLFVDRVSLPYETFFAAMPEKHRSFFATLALYVETADCICTHAGLNPSVLRLADQPDESFIWGHATFPDEYSGELPIVYGHLNNAQLDSRGWPQPRVIGNTIGIDTIAHGVLTAIRLPDRRLFQSKRYEAACR